MWAVVREEDDMINSGPLSNKELERVMSHVGGAMTMAILGESLPGALLASLPLLEVSSMVYIKF